MYSNNKLLSDIQYIGISLKTKQYWSGSTVWL